jgi:pimeloyl-ACP methyl ester carboxylesterase
MDKKRSRNTMLIVALVLMLGGSLLAGWMQTGAGAAQIREIRIYGSYNGYYDAYLWIPDGVTAENPAPAVLLAHGFNNSKEYMANTAIELARRGYVVLSMDLDNHGLSDKSKVPAVPFGSPSPNGIGTADGLLYLRSLDIVDTDNVGMMGMSMGGSAIDATAMLYPDKYKALFFMDSGCSVASCPLEHNWAISIGKTTETPPNFNAPNGAAIPSMPDALIAYGTDQPVVPGQVYGSFADDSARVFYFHWGDHPISTDDPTSIGNAISWFSSTMEGGKDIPSTNQIWPIKLLGTGVALFGFIIFLMAFGGALLDTSYFGGLKEQLPAFKGSTGATWWIFAVITGGLGPILLVPLFFKFFSANPLKLEVVTTGFVGWLLVVGLISIVILVVSYFTLGKKADANGVSYGFKWEGIGFDWKKIGKSFLLALTVIASGYLLLTIITALLKVDFRLWVVTLKTTDFRHFLVMLAYLIPVAIYFIPMSIGLHGTLRPKNGKASFAREMIVNVIILLVGYLIVEAYWYIPLTFFNGLSNFGPKALGFINGLALFVVVPTIALVSTYYFRKTGRIYVGAFLNILFVTWYLVAANCMYSF